MDIVPDLCGGFYARLCLFSIVTGRINAFPLLLAARACFFG